MSAARTAAIGRNTAIATATRTTAAAAAERRAIARLVEDREQPAFELPRARHAERGGRRWCRAECVGDVEQMPGVVARGRAGGEHAIVAGELLLCAQPLRRPPHARMRPVQRARAGGDPLDQAVAPRDVRQLVQQHRPPAIVGPVVGRRGKHDRRRDRAERQRHHVAFAAHQAHRPGKPKLRRRLVAQPTPRGVGHVT